MNSYNNYGSNYGGYSNGRYFNTPLYNVPSYQQNYNQRPVEQPQQNGIFFNNIRYVTPEDMKKYIVGLGQTDMLINMQDGIVKIVSADMTGNSFTRQFSFKEIDDKAQEAQKQPEINLDGYVKKEDLVDFIKVDALTQFSKQLDEKFDKLEKKIKINEILEEK